MKSRPLLIAVLCFVVLMSAPASAQWQLDGVPLGTAGYSVFPAIATDGAGGAIVTWIDLRSGSADVYAQRVNGYGFAEWPADGVAICTAAFTQVISAIVSDGAGGAIVVWHDQRSGDYDIYAQRINASGMVQWTADGVALCTAGDTQEVAAIVSDGAGGAIVAWEDFRGGVTKDIYAQRINASGMVQWTANGIALCAAPNNQDGPAIVSDAAGGAIVSWRDGRDFTWDVYAQRVNASGIVQWTANGVALSTAANDQHFPTMVSDGVGGAVVTWEDWRSGSGLTADIYAQRVNALGFVQWMVDGVSVCTAGDRQNYPTMVSDGASGAIVTWQDFRVGSGLIADVYAQRLNASGATQWTANGVALCTAANNQTGPTIASDGAGGAVVTWQDYRSGPDDVYAQRINASGMIQWIADGVPACTAANGQYSPKIAQSDNGGAIVTWFDNRSGTYHDVYAQRVAGSGSWGRPEPTITSVVDVSNDEGGFVRVRWNESSDTTPFYIYYVYRDDWGTWNYVGEVADNGGTTYSLAVPTLADSACGTPDFGHQFKVISESTVSTEESNVAYGRSVDNLAPPAPVLTAQLVGNEVTLTWTNTAPDIMSWTVYLSPLPGVAACGTDCYFADVYDATFTFEFGGPLGDMYWGVRAWDYHCNKGAMSNEAPILFPNTPVGNNVGVGLIDPVNGAPRGGVTFAQVTTEGRTDLEINTSGPTLPGTFAAGDGKYYHITTTASTTGSIQVCITYIEAELQVPEASLRLLHYDTAAMPPDWVDITTISDIDNNWVCGVTTHLSPFVIGAGSATPVLDVPAPTAFALHPNVPNPFNPQTTIHYDVPAAGADVNISIYDVAGRLVHELVNEHRAAGRWSVEWNGDDDRGQRVASGVYFYRMRAGSFVDTKKMVLLK